MSNLIEQSGVHINIVMLWAIWYNLYNLKNVKNNHGGVLLSVKLQAKACDLTTSNTHPWVIFSFFKLYKWYQIAQWISSKKKMQDIDHQ